jgi:hypothetical protein
MSTSADATFEFDFGYGNKATGSATNPNAASNVFAGNIFGNPEEDPLNESKAAARSHSPSPSPTSPVSTPKRPPPSRSSPLPPAPLAPVAPLPPPPPPPPRETPEATPAKKVAEEPKKTKKRVIEEPTEEEKKTKKTKKKKGSPEKKQATDKPAKKAVSKKRKRGKALVDIEADVEDDDGEEDESDGADDLGSWIASEGEVESEPEAEEDVEAGEVVISNDDNEEVDAMEECKDFLSEEEDDPVLRRKSKSAKPKKRSKLRTDADVEREIEKAVQSVVKPRKPAPLDSALKKRKKVIEETPEPEKKPSKQVQEDKKAPAAAKPIKHPKIIFYYPVDGWRGKDGWRAPSSDMGTITGCSGTKYRLYNKAMDFDTSQKIESKHVMFVADEEHRGVGACVKCTDGQLKNINLKQAQSIFGRTQTNRKKFIEEIYTDFNFWKHSSDNRGASWPAIAPILWNVFVDDINKAKEEKGLKERLVHRFDSYVEGSAPKAPVKTITQSTKPTEARPPVVKQPEKPRGAPEKAKQSGEEKEIMPPRGKTDHTDATCDAYLKRLDDFCDAWRSQLKHVISRIAVPDSVERAKAVLDNFDAVERMRMTLLTNQCRLPVDERRFGAADGVPAYPVLDKFQMAFQLIAMSPLDPELRQVFRHKYEECRKVLAGPKVSDREVFFMDGEVPFDGAV